MTPRNSASSRATTCTARFECRTTDTLIALGDNGRAYTVPVANLPSARGDGQPVTTMIDLASGTRIVHMIAAAGDTRWLFATRGGFGFIARLSDMISRQRGGKQFITLEDGDALLRPVPVFEGAQRLALLSAKGKFLLFGLDEVKTLAGGGRGTILMGLDGSDTLAQVVPIGAAGLRATGMYRNKQVEDVLSGAQLQAYSGQARAQGAAAGRPGQAACAVPGVLDRRFLPAPGRRSTGMSRDRRVFFMPAAAAGKAEVSRGGKGG